MPDRIPGEWLSAATLAIESQPAGSSSAHLARVALEVAVPLIRAAGQEGTETRWGVRITSVGGYHNVVPYPDEEAARFYAANTPLARDPQWFVRVVSQQVGPWTPVQGEEDGSA